MTDDLERTSEIQDGYFYTFSYNATNKDVDFDKDPYVFCIEPSLKNENFVVCLNFHYLPLDVRIDFLRKLNQHYDMIKGDERIVGFVAASTLRKSIPYGKEAVRVYDRKNINNLYRVPAKNVGKYIEYDGYFVDEKPGEVMNKYWENYGTSESKTPETKDGSEL
jgi:hypothetical protein